MLRPGHTDAACINGNALAPPYGQSMADIFVAARAAFSEVVRQGRSTRTLAANKVDFNGAYSNSNFKVVEFDSLVKIAATDASVWTCDESAPRELHHIVETGKGCSRTHLHLHQLLVTQGKLLVLLLMRRVGANLLELPPLLAPHGGVPHWERLLVASAQPIRTASRAPLVPVQHFSVGKGRRFTWPE